MEQKMVWILVAEMPEGEANIFIGKYESEYEAAEAYKEWDANNDFISVSGECIPTCVKCGPAKKIKK